MLLKYIQTTFHMQKSNSVKDALLGVAIGDALGVPVEFKSRKSLQEYPVTNMTEYGTHHQPIGTWSDDSSLTFCLAASLCEGYNLQDIANRFINWRQHGYWTAHGDVFDIGIATAEAIDRLANGVPSLLAGGHTETSNGNGSLMRILPLLFFIKNKSIGERFQLTLEVSSLTHRHLCSVIGCFIYLEFARLLLVGRDKEDAFLEMQQTVKNFLVDEPICSEKELNRYHRVLAIEINESKALPIAGFGIDNIQSSGYIVHTLEAAIWCLLTTNNFKDAVLKAVNLGSDTDTTAAVTGGLAGILYGSTSIPEDWLSVLAKIADIEDLADQLNNKYIIP